MVELVTYRNYSDSNVVEKTLAITNATWGKLLEDTSIQRPSFTLNISTYNMDSNFAYIPLFNRYYFITNVTILHGNMIRVDCDVDVLMSFAPEILNSSQLITRQQFEYNKNIVDDSMPFILPKQVQYLNCDVNEFTFMTGGENDKHYVFNAL